MDRKKHVRALTNEEKEEIVNESVQALSTRPSLSPAELKKQFVKVVINADGTPSLGAHVERIAKETEAALEELSNEIDNSEAMQAMQEKIDQLKEQKQNAVTFDGLYDANSNPVATVETVTEGVTAAREAIETDVLTYKQVTNKALETLQSEMQDIKKNGVIVGEDGKIPAVCLPSYVDDVIEGETLSDFPIFGEKGKIYVTTSDNKQYRWSGSGYAEISASLALGQTETTAYPGHLGKQNAAAIEQLSKDVMVDKETIVRNENGEMELCARYKDYLEEKLYLAPTVAVFTLANLASIYELGKTISPSSLTHRETRVGNIDGLLSVYVNSTVKKTIAAKDVQETLTLEDELDITCTMPQTVTYKLQGVNTRGGAFNRSILVSVVAPFFIGICNDTRVVATEIAAFRKQTLKAAIAGTYTVSVGNGYIFFCCDASQKINGITSSGFTVPMEYVGDVAGVDINGVFVTYKTYRTTNKVVAGTYTYVIT